MAEQYPQCRRLEYLRPGLVLGMAYLSFSSLRDFVKHGQLVAPVVKPQPANVILGYFALPDREHRQNSASKQVGGLYIPSRGSQAHKVVDKTARL